MRRKLIFAALFLVMLLGFTGCANANGFRAVFVTDMGQIAENPYLLNAWNGLEAFKKNHPGSVVEFKETQAEESVINNAAVAAARDPNVVWLVAGQASPAGLIELAKDDANVKFVYLDTVTDNLPSNAVGVSFQTEVSSCLVGYLAAYASGTGVIGFLGGMEDDVMERFEYGYRYGAFLAAQEMGKPIRVMTEYAGTYTDKDVGYIKAQQMYKNECDVIFQAAGTTGLGVIEAAKTLNKWVIGVDVDQYELAPGSVLTSALKDTKKAVESITNKVFYGEDIGGKQLELGLEGDYVGIPEKNANLDASYPGLYKQVMALEDKIRAQKITVPANKAAFEKLTASTPDQMRD